MIWRKVKNEGMKPCLLVHYEVYISLYSGDLSSFHFRYGWNTFITSYPKNSIFSLAKLLLILFFKHLTEKRRKRKLLLLALLLLKWQVICEQEQRKRKHNIGTMAFPSFASSSLVCSSSTITPVGTHIPGVTSWTRGDPKMVSKGDIFTACILLPRKYSKTMLASTYDICFLIRMMKNNIINLMQNWTGLEELNSKTEKRWKIQISFPLPLTLLRILSFLNKILRHFFNILCLITG